MHAWNCNTSVWMLKKSHQDSKRLKYCLIVSVCYPILSDDKPSFKDHVEQDLCTSSVLFIVSKSACVFIFYFPLSEVDVQRKKYTSRLLQGSNVFKESSPHLNTQRCNAGHKLMSLTTQHWTYLHTCLGSQH